MRKLLILKVVLILSSCVPYKVAPRFNKKPYKIIKAKKFKKKLSNQISFVFKDPKEADEFYNYINTKFQLNNKDVGLNSPFFIENKKYFLTYYEVDKNDESIILPLVLIDAKRATNDNDPLFENKYTKRKGHWYIVITVFDSQLKNCLKDKHPKRSVVVNYLKQMQNEYLSMYNYEELLFQKKS